MKLQYEIAALYRMRERNSNTGEVKPFIFSVITVTGKVFIWIDWYFLSAIREENKLKTESLLHSEFDVDRWELMKQTVGFSASSPRARLLWRVMYRRMRQAVGSTVIREVCDVS